MKQFPNLSFTNSRLFIYQNSFLIVSIIVLFAASCGGNDDDMGPTTKPPTTTNTVSVKIKSDREGEIYKGLDANKNVLATGNTNNTSTTAELKITTTSNKSSNSKTANKAANITLAQVVGLFGTDTIYKAKNVTLKNTPDTEDVSNSKTQYSHDMDWEGNKAGATFTVYDNNKILTTNKSQDGNPPRVNLTFFDDKNLTAIDSIIGELEGYHKIKVQNIEIAGATLYQGGVGPNGQFKFIELGTETNNTGDVAINPMLLNTPKKNTTITMTNVEFPEYTYTINTDTITTGPKTQAIFRDIHVQNKGPIKYEVIINGNEIDGFGIDIVTSSAIIDIYQDEEGEINGVKEIQVIDVPNDQDINTYVWDVNDPTQTVSNAEVKMINADTQEIMYTTVSDSEGEVYFENVPENTNIRLQVSKSGYYTKTNGTYRVPDVEYTHQMSETLNIAAVEKIEGLSASDIMTELTQTFDISFILGNKPIYLPPITGGNQIYKDHFNEVAELLGMPGAFTFVDSPGPQNYDASYYANPYPIDRDFTPMINNVTDYSGGNVSTNVATLFNENNIITHTKLWELGGIGDWSNTDHEILGALNQSQSHSVWPTPLDSDGGGNVSLKDSPKTLAIQKSQTRTAVLHYDTIDYYGNIIEYALPVKYE